LLEKVQEKHGKAFHFIWLDGVNQPEFANEWGLSSSYPTIVTFNHKKMSIVPYIGSFSEEAVNDYLNKILRGARRASPISKVPSIIAPQGKDEL